MSEFSKFTLLVKNTYSGKTIQKITRVVLLIRNFPSTTCKRFLQLFSSNRKNEHSASNKLNKMAFYFYDSDKKARLRNTSKSPEKVCLIKSNFSSSKLSRGGILKSSFSSQTFALQTFPRARNERSLRVQVFAFYI